MALLTFQLKVTAVPGGTVLELAVKLVIVGGCAGVGGGFEEALPDPQPVMTKVVAKRIKTMERNWEARVVVTFLPFRGTRCAHQGEYLRNPLRSSGSGLSCQSWRQTPTFMRLREKKYALEGRFNFSETISERETLVSRSDAVRWGVFLVGTNCSALPEC